MPERPPHLPDFDNPPITEVVLGVQFASPNPLQVVHLGLYWDLVRQDFPHFEVQHPVPPPGQVGMGITTGPPATPRCWFLDRTKNRLIQVQPDRFIHNWRKLKGEDPYPRYETIRDEFARRWLEFADFAGKRDLGEPKITACELTYVNHLRKGTCWSQASEIPGVFTVFAERIGRGSLPPPDTLGVTLQFAKDGMTLTVDLTPAVMTFDQEEVQVFSLAARGPSATGQVSEAMDWFDTAREGIVLAFAELTSDLAHRAWKRKR